MSILKNNTIQTFKMGKKYVHVKLPARQQTLYMMHAVQN